MNARPLKITITLCLFFLSTLTGSLRAQDTGLEDANSSPGRMGPGQGRVMAGGPPVAPLFNIQIENGRLSLEPLKDKPTQNPWSATLARANSSAPGTIDTSIPATIDNLSKYMRVIDTNLNIVLSPDVGNIVVQNLKLNTRNVGAVHEAIAVASGGAILNNGGGGGFGRPNGMGANLTFVSGRSNTRPSVEVFNLTGYIQTLGKVDDTIVREKIDGLLKLTQSTLVDDMKMSPGDQPNFKFHPGTKLLIVVGKPEAIDLARKIINALPGQQPNAKADLPLDSAAPPDQK